MPNIVIGIDDHLNQSLGRRNEPFVHWRNGVSPLCLDTRFRASAFFRVACESSLVTSFAGRVYKDRQVKVLADLILHEQQNALD